MPQRPFRFHGRTGWSACRGPDRRRPVAYNLALDEEGRLLAPMVVRRREERARFRFACIPLMRIGIALTIATFAVRAATHGRKWFPEQAS